VWIYEFARGTMTRLTNGEFASRPTWSPDGTQVAYGIRPQGLKSKSNLWQIAMKPADGSRDAVQLLELPRRQLPTGFTPDGKQLVFDCGHDPQRASVCTLPIGAKGEPNEVVGGTADTSGGVISPDGRWIAYVSADAGQNAVFVRPFPQGQGRWQIAQGNEPRWAPDGRSLFFRDNGELRVAPIDTSRGFNPGRPERICDHVPIGGNVSTYGVAPDGRKVLVFRGPQGQGSEHTIYLDRNFAARLAAP
jgi:Tol biopolymer transport system component